jgi:hypothetical protein
MTRSFLGASLVTLACLSLAAACGDDSDDGNNNGNGGTGGGATAGTGNLAGSGTGGTSAAGTNSGGTAGTGLAGGGSLGGSTNTGVQLDAGLGGGDGEDSGAGEQDSGGGGPQVDAAFVAFQATVFPVLQNKCNTCHVGANPPDGAGIGINNAATAYAEFIENANGTTSPRYNLIVTRLNAGSMPPQCGNNPPGGDPDCVTPAQFAAVQAWVTAFGD